MVVATLLTSVSACCNGMSDSMVVPTGDAFTLAARHSPTIPERNIFFIECPSTANKSFVKQTIYCAVRAFDVPTECASLSPFGEHVCRDARSIGGSLVLNAHKFFKHMNTLGCRWQPCEKNENSTNTRTPCTQK